MFECARMTEHRVISLGDLNCSVVCWFHSVRPSVRPASRVRSVAPTVLVGSISYLHILSSNFRRCVVCKFFGKISKFKFFAIFQNLYLWLCLVLTWELMWITSMGNHGASGGISERRRSSCSSFNFFLDEILSTIQIQYIETAYDFHQLIYQPTRVGDKTSSVLDVILTSHPVLHRKGAVLKYTLNDHYLIFTHITSGWSQHCEISWHEKFRYVEFLQWSNFMCHS